MGGIEDILSEAASATTQMTPDRTGSLTSMQPSPMQMPPPPVKFNAPELQFGKAGNEFQTVSGRKRADRQALISNTVNFVKSGADYVQAKKQRTLSMSIERLLSAQEGLQEAKASGDQTAIQRNSAIINDITSDPKMVKQLQKAFSIDLTGSGKNKNENMALQEAWKNYSTEKQKNPNALNPIAQKFVNSQPMRQQLSPEAQAQAAAIKAGLLPGAKEVLQAGYENFKTIMAAKSSEDRDKALEEAAKIRADAEIKHGQSIYDAALQRYLGTKMAVEVKERTEKYKADSVAKTWDKRLAKMDEWTKMKTGSSPIITNLTKEARSYNDRLKNLIAENTKYEQTLKKSTGFMGLIFGNVSSGDAKIMRNKIMINNLEIRQIQSDLDGVTKKMQLMDKMGVINIQELQSGDQSSGGGDSSPITVPDEDVTGGEDQ